MPIFHFLLVLLVAIIWGVNFLFLKWGLAEIPPLLLCALRFMLASIPAIFFIKPPQIYFKVIAAYGLIMFGLQFSLLFLGIYVGMTAGMASLVMQVQVFFSMFFAAVLLGEKPTRWQISGALIAFIGIAIVALHVDHEITPLGLVLILAAAATWGIGNLIIKKTQPINMVAFIVWGSFIAFIPMLLMSLLFEGTAKLIYTYHHLTWQGINSLFYTVYISTWVGYGLWNWLLSRYPLGNIAPFILLVPVIGIFSSILILNEEFQMWKLTSSSLVITGLFISILGARLFTIKKVSQEEVSVS